MSSVLDAIAHLGGLHNRHFTGATEMAIAGPLEASPVLITPYSPVGNRARGQLANFRQS